MIGEEGATDSKVKTIYRELQVGANAARSTDTSRIKSSVAEWLNAQTVGRPDPLLTLASRKERGIQNDTTGRLLCSISLDWDDQDVRTKIRNYEGNEYYYGKDFFPRCLFAGEKGNPNRVRDGYLRSTLLVKTFKAIFTSPSSVTKELDTTQEPAPKKMRKSTNAIPHRADVTTTLNMYQVTPRSIAYAAVQLHFALQNASLWCEVYDNFNYKDFYWFIIDYLGAGSTNAKDLLDWWNEQVFPDAAPPQDGSQQSAMEASMALLMVQQEVD